MQIIVDTQMSTRLTGLTEPVPIYDSVGNMLGIFSPVSPEIDYSKIVIPYTEEELEAARNEPGGRPLAEILRDLQANS